jgi:hypothetical protein
MKAPGGRSSTIKTTLASFCIHALMVLCVLALIPRKAFAQTGEHTSDTSEIKALVLQLQADLKRTQQELAREQQEVERLARQLDIVHGTPASAMPPGSTYLSPVDVNPEANGSAEAPSEQDNTAATEPLLRAQINEQQQTKVESASKYRVKLSGLILMTAFSNRGAVDHPDIANRAFGSSYPGSIGASLRQSIIGLQVIGPEIAGGRSSASIAVDFAGGFPSRPYGSTMGLMRLRQATARVDWENGSLIVGQEAPFVSPLSPTSYATVAEPALSWAGNLWVWTPQVFAEHKFRYSDSSYFSLGGGLAVPLTEDIPDSQQFPAPTPGEQSRRPAFEAVAGWHSKAWDQPVTIGLGGYVGRQKYSFGRNTDAWAGTAFWEVPITRFFTWSGEGYRGQAAGGLGAGIWQSVVYNGDPANPLTGFRPVNSIGGWTQLKYKALPKLDFNVAVGQDNVLSDALRWAPQIVGEYGSVFARNRTGFANAVFRPKSNLLLSVEYRKLWTWRYVGAGNQADQVNVAAGVSF